MGEETKDNADAHAASGGGGEESQSESPPASPETVPPGFEPHRSPSPPPPGFESRRPPVPPPVSQEFQLIPVMSLSQSITQTREGNKDMDGGSVTVAYESPSESMASSPDTVPPGWEAHRSPSPPPPTSLPVSQEIQLKRVVSSSQSTAQTRDGEMGGNVDKDGGSVTVAQESPSKSMASSPETAPPGWEVLRPPSPPPPTPLPVSEKSQLEPVGSSCQALSLLNATQTTGEETEGNENKDDGSVTVSHESPSKPMARLPETAPPSWESLCPPSLLSPPPPTPLPVSEESQLIPTASSSQALSLLNVAQTMGEETEGNENKDGRSVTVSKESPSKPMASLPGTAPPGLESLRPPSPLPSPLVPTLFPDEKVLERDTEESSPSNHQTFEHSKQASSSEPTINLGQMVCGTCRALLSYPRGARRVQCPCCHTLNFVLEAHEICLAECGKCEVLLMYQHGAPAVRCSHCNFVTTIGEHNSRTLDSVLQGYPLQPQIPVYESTQLNALAVQNPRDLSR